jgi:hypothetical protein
MGTRLKILGIILIILFKYSRIAVEAISTHMANAKVYSSTSYLPEFTADERLQVYHMRSKVLPIIRTSSESYNEQTSGIAFRRLNDRHSQIVVLQLVPVNATICYLPIIEGSGTNARLVWNKRAQIYYSFSLDAAYWKTSTYMGEVNGVVYSHFMEWVSDYLKNNGHFIPYSVCMGYLDCALASRQGDRFLEGAFQRLANLAVHLLPLTTPRKTDLVMTSTYSPQNVYLDGASEGSTVLGRSVINYYQMLRTCLDAVQSQSSTKDMATAMSSCHKDVDVAYVHVKDGHYLTFKGGNPFATTVETSQVIPEPTDLPAPGISITDKVIAAILLVFIIMGIIACLYRLYIIQYIYGVLKNRRTRVTAKASADGGYSQASELPRYVEWNWMKTLGRKQEDTGRGRTRSSSNVSLSSNVNYSPVPGESVGFEDADEGI